MKKTKSGKLLLSPTDLTRFYESEFSSWMDHYYETSRENGPLKKVSKNPPDPLQGLLAEKGNLHEDFVLRKILENNQVAKIERLENEDTSVRIEKTRAAMKAGEPYIYQAALDGDTFFGYADLLRRVPGDSELGEFHYEPLDMKISLSPKPTAIIQLCAYADALMRIQGRLPKRVTVITKDGENHIYLTERFFAFYKAFKRRFLEFHNKFDPHQQPLPLKGDEHREWSMYSKRILFERDDVQLTAKIRQNYVEILRAHGVDTMQALAEIDPKKAIGDLAEGVLRNLSHQARLQVQSAKEQKIVFEVLEHQPQVRFGLAMLPEAHEKDLFFDMEGYPLLGSGGLEYLYGMAERGQGRTKYHEFWAKSPSEEGRAFKAFMEFAYSRWTQHRDLHIYHYGHYEPSTLKRLMGQYGICERMMGELLRNEVFVDLYQVVQGLRIGTHSYGLKAVERLYYPERDTEVSSGAESAIEFSSFLESGNEQFLDRIRLYNQDDCFSAKDLESFLRSLKDKNRIFFVSLQTDEQRQRVVDQDAIKERCSKKAEELLAALPIERRGLGFESSEPADYVQELLSHMLDFHRREDSPDWWDYFRRRDLSAEQLLDEVSALADVQIVGTNSDGELECVFNAAQDTKFRSGDEVLILENRAPFENLKIKSWDILRGRLALSGTPSSMPEGKFTLAPAKSNIRKDALLQSLLDQANGFSRTHATFGLREAIFELLLKRPPRVSGAESGAPLINAGKEIVPELTRTVLAMNNSCLCVQGPPGTGKTFTGAHVIAALLKAGKSVAISSNSHKAINNLLRRVDEVCGANRSICRPVKLTSQGKVGEESIEFSNTKIPVKSNATSLKVLFGDSSKPLHREGAVNVAGATAYYLCKPELVDQFDYLFVDEATQVCLPNLIAMARCADNIVLMGDQNQLDQPTQATHPGDSGNSAFVHLTDGKSVIEATRGVFLPVTYRMNPKVTSVVSELFYEGELHSAPNTEKQEILWSESVDLRLPPAGIHFHPVDHTGNTHGSVEEAVEIKKIIDLALKSKFRNKAGKEMPVTMENILIVAPYNYQVSLLREYLANGAAKIGSVDLFQGQEAPLVILSLCASTAKDAPRGIAFLLNRNRMNVALSRAESLVIVVGSPALAAGRTSTVGGLELMNVICRVAAPNGER